MHLANYPLFASIIFAHANNALDAFAFGSFTMPATYAVALQNGLFQKHNLNVTYMQIPNSTAGYAALIDGTYDLLLGAVDNVINRRWNSGIPLSIIGQLDLGADFVLESIPNITSIDQLRGKPLMVDSPVSGYAYALELILSLHGLNLANGDYSFTTVGGSNLRYAALINGTYNGSAVYATMQTTPFTAYGNALPLGQRPNILARTSDYLYPYPSNSLTVTTAATASNATRSRLVRFMAAMLQANMFLSTPSNKNASIAAISKTLNISTSLASAEYVADTDPLTGETTALQGGLFRVSTQGIWNLISTRKQFNGWAANVSEGFDFAKAVVPGKGQLIDYSLIDEALAASMHE